MITLDDIRDAAAGLPEVTESRHFGLPAFKVGDKVFVVHQRGGTHAILHVDEPTATSAATEQPEAVEVVRRNDGRILVGVRVDLASVQAERFGELVEQAWRHRAPKRLVAAYEAER